MNPRRFARSLVPTLVLGSAVAAGLVGLGGCKKKDDAATAEPARSSAPAAAPVPVKLAKVESRVLPGKLDLTGTLEADERSEVAAQGGGAVIKVNVDVGSRVKKGDVLVELDGRDASLRLQTANAQTAQSLARLGIKAGEPLKPEQVADVRMAQEAMTLAEQEEARAKKLLEGGGITQAAYDQAKTNAERTRAAYDVAKNGVDQAWAGLLASRAQAGVAAKSVDDTRIRAPFDGAIAEKRIAPGEYAQVGRVVAILVRDNPLRLKMDVPEATLAGIVPEQKVELSVAAFPQRTFTGTIKRIGASVKVQSRTLPVEAEIPNDDGALRPGFFARVLLTTQAPPAPALVVPKKAVNLNGSTARVFVRQGSRVVERLVTTGLEAGDHVEVRGAIAAGDEVVVEGVESMADGAEVAVAP